MRGKDREGGSVAYGLSSRISGSQCSARSGGLTCEWESVCEVPAEGGGGGGGGGGGPVCGRL